MDTTKRLLLCFIRLCSYTCLSPKHCLLSLELTQVRRSVRQKVPKEVIQNSKCMCLFQMAIPQITHTQVWLKHSGVVDQNYTLGHLQGIGKTECKDKQTKKRLTLFCKTNLNQMWADQVHTCQSKVCRKRRAIWGRVSQWPNHVRPPRTVIKQGKKRGALDTRVFRLLHELLDFVFTVLALGWWKELGVCELREG